jgi:hypothetical protein
MRYERITLVVAVEDYQTSPELNLACPGLDYVIDKIRGNEVEGAGEFLILDYDSTPLMPPSPPAEDPVSAALDARPQDVFEL